MRVAYQASSVRTPVLREGFMPKEHYNRMDRKDQKFPPPPTSSGDDYKLDGVGVAGRKACATNSEEAIADISQDDGVSEDIPNREATTTFIQAMQARAKEAEASSKQVPRKPTLHDKDPMTPGQLMSSQNKSPHQLIPQTTYSTHENLTSYLRFRRCRNATR